MPNNLVFLAGAKAYSVIKEKGLHPEMVKVIAGAAGGPKWLVLSHLDQFLFSTWLKNRSEPLFLIGSSIGAWRFAAAARPDPQQSIERFLAAYLDQSYSIRPTRQEITRETSRIRDTYLAESGIQEILDHPYLRLNFMAVRCKWPNSAENKILLGAGLLGAALSNAVNRKFLKFFFERTLFYHPATPPPFFEKSEFTLQKVPLDKDNLASALLASGSIPLVMSGITDIKGSRNGVYRDGGIIDYHMDIPFLNNTDEKIVLFPHYSERIIPGWLDKKLRWRTPQPSNMDQVLLVAPSQSFVDSLPFKKIPDRHDFWTFSQKDEERINYWKTVISQSAALGHEFTDAVESGKIKDLVKPMVF
ncbi:MAG: patatin-like phospholipase family protein [bacterium]